MFIGSLECSETIFVLYLLWFLDFGVFELDNQQREKIEQIFVS